MKEKDIRKKCKFCDKNYISKGMCKYHYGKCWRAKNKERIKIYNKRKSEIYYKENREYLIKKTREYSNKHPIQTKYYQICSGAKQRNINFNIGKKEFINWFNNSKKICEYCKDTFTPKHFYDRLSIDRKNTNKGYSIDNICMSCFWCNNIKGIYFSYDEMKKIGNTINKIKKKRKNVITNNALANKK